MNPLLMYGHGYQPNTGSWDTQDETTEGILDLYGRNKAYDDSVFGKVANWVKGQQARIAPNAMAENASIEDQAGQAGNRLMNLPMNMLLGGINTANNWAGSPGFPERVEHLDMLAPLGIGAVAGLAGAVPRRAAVRSTNGRAVSNQIMDLEPVDAAMRFDPTTPREMRSKHWPKSWFQEFHGDGNPTDVNPKNWDPRTVERAKLFVRDMEKRDQENAVLDPMMWDGDMPKLSRLDAERAALSNPETRGILEDAYSSKQDFYEHVNPNWRDDPYAALNYPSPPGTDPMSKVNDLLGSPPRGRNEKFIAADQSRASAPGLFANGLDTPSAESQLEIDEILRHYGIRRGMQ